MGRMPCAGPKAESQNLTPAVGEALLGGTPHPRLEMAAADKARFAVEECPSSKCQSGP